MTRLQHEIEISPAFHDLDPMNIVWHGNYAKYLERARCALLAQFNYDYPQMRESGFAWPIVEMRLKYVRPIYYGRRVKIVAEVVEWENRLRINYLVSDAQTGERINQAHTIQVAVNMSTQEMCFVSPDVLLERLGVKRS